MSAADLDRPRTVIEGVLESRLADGYVLLQPATGEYYGLDELGSLLWDELKQGMTPADFIARHQAGFDVPPIQFSQDIAALVRDLEQCRLIAVDAE